MSDRRRARRLCARRSYLTTSFLLGVLFAPRLLELLSIAARNQKVPFVVSLTVRE